MSPTFQRPRFHGETGGITILVALMLLVLLTVAAIGMSRNSFREIVSSGTIRQGAMVRNTADAGVEWAIFWLDTQNQNNSGPSGTALDLAALKTTLLQDDTKSGKAFDVHTQAIYTRPSDDVSTLQADQKLTLPVAANNQTTQGFSLAMTRMGKLPITDMSQGVQQGTFSPAQGGVSKQAPDLWAIRSDAQVQVGTGAFAPNFQYSKEAWISTPVQ